jgi:hypothetical protein
VAVEREKAVQALAVHRECKKCVVTFWVMSQFSHLQGVVQTFMIQLLFLGLTNRTQRYYRGQNLLLWTNS